MNNKSEKSVSHMAYNRPYFENEFADVLFLLWFVLKLTPVFRYKTFGNSDWWQKNKPTSLSRSRFISLNFLVSARTYASVRLRLFYTTGLYLFSWLKYFTPLSYINLLIKTLYTAGLYCISKVKMIYTAELYYICKVKIIYNANLYCIFKVKMSYTTPWAILHI